MAADEGHNAMLDQLQSQVNLITGRVFAAIATKPDERPAAQIIKLKNSLPIATNTFHNALDQLESQLQLATLVMRRDLAVCHERAGTQAKAAIEQSQPQPQSPSRANASPDPIPDSQAISEPNEDTDPPVRKPAAPAPQPPLVDDDVDMADWLESQADEKPNAKSDQSVTAAATAPGPSPPLANGNPNTAAHTLSTTLSDAKAPITTALQLDMNAVEQPKTDEQPTTADDEKAPDTANDLDSLFNDPTSAGANDTSNDFPFDDNGTADMVDFSTFGGNFDSNADNDNISSLLPGLEDYANTQPATVGAVDELDFNSLFNVTGGDEGSNNGAMNSQGAGEQRDTTFDDLMDLANFDVAGMEGDDAGGEGGATDLDFDSLFNS